MDYKIKYNFIVSDYRKLWIESATRLFIVEPYVYYQLKKDGHVLDYAHVIVAPHRRKSSSDLEKDYNFVQLKLDKYVNILAERLNQIHGTSYCMPFWKKALSVSFERYITFLHEMYENCELYLDVDKHDFYVLSNKSYHIPLDFDAQRDFFQHSHYGQEQIFSIYMHTFYPDGLKTKDDQFKTNIESRLRSSKKYIVLRLLRQIISKATLEKVKRELLKKYYASKAHKIGIMGSAFSAKYLNLLMIKSKGSIYPLEWQIDINGNDADSLLWDSRKYLSESQCDYDRFDRFFFASIEYCLPKTFVEYFKRVENGYMNYFKKYEDLRFVVSEAWPSVNNLSIALALLKERGVRHIYNEHNYIAYPWVGSEIYQLTALSDIFVSLGWYSDKILNIVKGASLFEFILDKKFTKHHKICYVAGIPLVKRPQYTAAYGENAENAIKHIDFVRVFFENLSYETRCEMLFRGYPESSSENWLYYDYEFILKPYLNSINKFNYTTTYGQSLMLQSNLVVVDYIGTSYLQSMLMNIPTVFFWKPDTYYLDDEYLDFFDSLISVGICQTDPIAAACFVESIKEDPQKWWMQDKVQKAKNSFLNQNIGKPEVMINFLMGLIKSDDNLTINQIKEIG
jgi:putative transferase (TIGR04331 family)